MSGLRSVARPARALCILLCLIAGPSAWAGSTVFRDTDNENNAGTGVADNDMDRLVGRADGAHPIEFNINVTTLPTTSAKLTLRAYDVDEESGEVDEVYLNGVLLGRLSGANNTWNATVFTVNPAIVLPGNNKITVDVDTSGDSTDWVVNVDWAQLLGDGGAANQGNTQAVRITNYSIAAGTVTVNTRATVQATAGGDYRVETAIIDPNGNTTSVVSQDFTALAGALTQVNQAPTYPLNSGSGVYTIQAQLFHINGSGFPVQQDIRTAQFAHTANVGPTDSDNDGLTDAQELLLGTDRFNPDTDGDGENDNVEIGNVASPTDSDGDGTLDALESSVTDSDGDGVPNETDPQNANPCVPNANSTPCLALDTDGDGLTNGQEATLGTNPNAADTDGDGVNDGVEVGGNVNLPADSDGDGIINALESSITDTDGDGTPNQSDPGNTDPCVPNVAATSCQTADSDGDGLSNAQEIALGLNPFAADSDGDGTNDSAELGGTPSSPRDTDGDGIIDALESSTLDTDGDGIANASDTDSDNDGIPDSVERGVTSGAPLDTDGDGIADYLDRDSDGDRIPDALEARPSPTSPPDTDGDGRPDYRDRDADGDGLPDTLEGNAAGIDTDADGIDNAFDVDVVGGGDANHDGVGDGAVLPDTDGDTLPDFRDIDSDHDGILDRVEGNASGSDADNDGIDNAMDPDFTAGADANGDRIDDSYRFPDTDADGVPDFRDLDTDNDGVFDVVEAGLGDTDNNALLDSGVAVTGTPRDSDSDGIGDFRELDADNDGTRDIVTAGFGSLDTNNDGRLDAVLDRDDDGIADVRDRSPLTFGANLDSDGDGVPDATDLDLDNDGIPNAADGPDDTDGDGIPNLLDLDSDNDGIADVVEAGGIDADNNGVIDGFTDTNANGLADSVETARGGTPLPLPDTDRDGIDDHRDTDSDGDTLDDIIEAGGTDADRDGRVDGTTDADHDGWIDSVDRNAGGTALAVPDTDGDGVRDFRDLDSDGDNFPDREEATVDANHNGIPDYRDPAGVLSTAVRGVGSFDFMWIGALLLLLALRMRRQALLAIVAVLGFAITPAQAAEQGEPRDPYFVGGDLLLSHLKPEDRGAGYAVDDTSSSGFRLYVGYQWAERWAAELFYLSEGKAGIASQNAAIGHLGAIGYKLYGAGAQWLPFKQSSDWLLKPYVKAGLVKTGNSVTDNRIRYDREHGLGVYLGLGATWAFLPRWQLVGEVVSYDKDERTLSLGVRWKFGEKE
jgi:large repetitive protein